MGYNNVVSLKKGIIAYEKWVDEVEEATVSDGGTTEASPGDNNSDSNSDSDSNDTSNSIGKISRSISDIDSPSTPSTSYFQGKNFLFDRRRMSDEVQDLQQQQQQQQQQQTTVVTSGSFGFLSYLSRLFRRS